ncbi:MAG: NAD(+) synthase [Oscillospiraceae bacterium]|nr:NAD(+) synthase [Oscillospiraceae bacterium]
MKDGLIKTAAATPRIRVADCEGNSAAVIEKMKEAAALGAGLLVLPELCLTGYTCGDLFGQTPLLEGALCALRRCAKASRGLSLLTLVGVPLRHKGKLYNCAAVLWEGEILGVVPKTFLPNYGEFYEKRNFAAAPPENGVLELDGRSVPFGTKLLFQARELPDLVLAVEICEDLWSAAPPCVLHAAAGATVIANLSASDETIGKADYRRALVGGQSARLLCAYLYADAGEGESTTDMTFAGHNLIAENGALLAESALFRNETVFADLDLQRLAFDRRRNTTFPESAPAGYQTVFFSMPLRETVLQRHISPTPFVPPQGADREQVCATILDIQSQGLRRRLEHSHSAKAVIGVSGGLDSTLAMLVAARALKGMGRPASDLMAVTMPCFGTTQRTRGNAEILSRCLGADFRTVDITAAVRQHFADIGQPEEDHSVTYENCQARERTQVLMDLANQCGGMVVGTGDLSELALGWATYNGDHMSMYGVNSSIPKTLIRYIIRHAAGQSDDPALQKVLFDILDTPVSPELLPAKDGVISQVTEDIVGPYELHDFFLYYTIRWGFSPAKIFRLARRAFSGSYGDDVILRWLSVFFRRFFQQQFKRSCLPDGPKVGSVTLSPRGDWRMPSDACAALWLSEIAALEKDMA